MRAALITLIILFSFITETSELIEFIPSWKNPVSLISWGFLAILIIIFLIQLRPASTLHLSKGKISIGLSILFLVFVVAGKLLLFFAGKSQEEMYPMKLIDKAVNDGTCLYLFSYDNFPDAGTGIILKKEGSFLPVMKELKRIDHFEFSKKSETNDSIIYYSEEGKKLCYDFHSGNVNITE